MKFLLMIAALVFTVGCGSDDTQFASVNPLQDFADEVGQQVNFARKHLSDRNMSGTDLQNGMNTVADQTSRGYVDGRDNTGASANRARGYMSDRNVSGTDLQNFTNDAAGDTEAAVNTFARQADDNYVNGRDGAGAEANRTREYLYERGVREMKYGRGGDRGETGDQGNSGSDGQDGDSGSDGSNGSSCTVESITSGTLIVCGSDWVLISNGNSGSDGQDGDSGNNGNNGNDSSANYNSETNGPPAAILDAICSKPKVAARNPHCQ